MSDQPKKPDFNKEDRGYVPASPVKRTMAWIGLVYMLIFLALTTYFYFTGTMLGNLAPLLTVPGLIGLGVLCLVSWKSTGSPSRAVAILLAIVFWVLAAFSLPLGIVGLMSNFEMVGVTFITTPFGG